MSEGYYRFPTIHGDQVAFTCEDDLWVVPRAGGVARRLTSNLGAVGGAVYSPDGTQLAFTGSEEGPPEVYVMPAEGGQARRLTYLAAGTAVAGWTPDGQSVIFSSNARRPMLRMRSLLTVAVAGEALPDPMPWGPATAISYSPEGGCVLGRHAADPARWKRYRGGTAGELWVDRQGKGTFRPLIKLAGNLAAPMWIGKRIYFLSDHEGIANLYSCTPTGRGLRRHTDCDEFYLRNPSTDGRRIVFHAGADLFCYDPQDDATVKIDVELRSPRVPCRRKFVSAEKYLDGYALHPKGHSAAMTSRGKLFSAALWEGAVADHNDAEGVRRRLAHWLKDGERIVCVSDSDGEPRLEVHRADLSEEPVLLGGLDIGTPTSLSVSPTRNLVAISNHRCELIVVDLDKARRKVVDHSVNGSVGAADWSPDGQWLAYSYPVTPQTRCLKLYSARARKSYEITEPVLADFAPAFDPDGKYLYFLGFRDLDPVYDHLHFDLNFPRGLRPYLITLRKDLPSPFLPVPRAPGGKAGDGKNDKSDDDPADRAAAKDKDKPGKDKPKPVKVDLDGIARRVLAFPAPLGRYGQVAGLPGGKVLFTSFPLTGTLGRAKFDDDKPGGTLEMYDFQKQEKQVLLREINDFVLSGDHKTMLYRSGARLRAVKAGEKTEKSPAKDPPGRKSGWLDLGRLKVSVVPVAEWRQMYREAWRLQRDHFWTENMSNVDWSRVYDRYRPLVERLGTRAELADLMWEMQGELGTSHAYEMGGDYRAHPHYRQGLLGAEFVWDAPARGYRITQVIRGDSWDPAADSPLAGPGVNVVEGDVLLAVGGRKLTRDLPPDRLLVNRAGEDVSLTVRSSSASGKGKRTRTVVVKPLSAEWPARYRQWVQANRRHVHEATGGRVGYLHIPDMSARGFAEFHRLYLAEFDRDGLIVDVRCNGGGHVSQLLLEKLARRRVGYDLPRWGAPDPYPAYSTAGPIVALTDELAGSDGDIFSHCFKLMKLGTLVGKRTWGGVVGINPRSRFVDGGLTTQPEYSFWFEDVGWGVENYGTDPDVEVTTAPQDHAAGRDTQLEKTLQIILRQLKKTPPRRPTFDRRPDLSLPRLPPR